MSSRTIIDDTRAALVEQRGNFRQLAAASGLSVSWLSKFANGRRGERVSYETLQALRKALEHAQPPPPSTDPPPADTTVEPIASDWPGDVD